MKETLKDIFKQNGIMLKQVFAFDNKNYARYLFNTYCEMRGQGMNRHSKI